MCGRFGLRGMGPAPARKLGGGSAFALCTRGEGDRFQRGLRTHPAPLAYFWLGMGPAPDRKLGGGSAFALCGKYCADRFQRGLRTHPAAALGLSTWTPREGTRCFVWSVGIGSAGWVLRPTGSSGEDQLSRCARWEGVIASNAGYGPIPLPRWGCRHGHRERGLAAVCWRWLSPTPAASANSSEVTRPLKKEVLQSHAALEGYSSGRVNVCGLAQESVERPSNCKLTTPCQLGLGMG